MASFWKIVNNVIEKSDVVLEVLDARFIELTRNKEIEDKVKEKGKRLFFVVNKADLISKIDMQKIKNQLKNVVFVSSTKKLGTSILKRRLLEIARGNNIIVGVVGYPNTGKSSIINALKGRRSAPASSVSGFTKGKQIVRIASNLMLLDSPGVIPYLEKDKIKHIITGAMSAEKIKDPESAAEELIETLDGRIEKFYRIKQKDALEHLAFKWNMLKKGGKPDTARAARKLLDNWQKGKLI